jgi:hypothetical protein
LDDFRRLAETFGGDPERWPEPTRAAARRIARSPEGVAVLARERRLDLAFEQAPVIDPRRADDVAFRVLQRIAAEPPSPARLAGALRWLLPAASLACSVLIGVALALELPFAAAPPPAAAIIAMTVDSGSLAGDWGLP